MQEEGEDINQENRRSRRLYLIAQANRRPALSSSSSESEQDNQQNVFDNLSESSLDPSGNNSSSSDPGSIVFSDHQEGDLIFDQEFALNHLPEELEETELTGHQVEVIQEELRTLQRRLNFWDIDLSSVEVQIEGRPRRVFLQASDSTDSEEEIRQLPVRPVNRYNPRFNRRFFRHRDPSICVREAWRSARGIPLLDSFWNSSKDNAA